MYDAGTAALTVTVSFRGVQKEIQKQAKLIAAELQRAIAGGLRDGYDGGGRDAPPAGTKAGAAYGQSFAETVRKRIDAALKSLPEAKVDADTSQADRRIQEIRKELAELSKQNVGVDIDEGEALKKLRSLQQELTKIGHESPSVRVAMDTSTASAQLGKLREEVDRLAVEHANIRPVVDDGPARTKLESLRLAADRLRTVDPTINVDADTGKAQASLLGLSLRIGQVSRSMTGIGLKAAGIGAIGVASASSAVGVLRLAGALAPLSGLAIGMPAAIGGAVLALGSLKLALSGVGDTVSAGMAGDWKKYNDEIKKLAPNAQTAVGAIVALRKPLHDMQQAVQQTFFAGINKQIDLLGKRALPTFQASLVKVSGGLNAIFKNLLTGLSGRTALAGLSAVANNLSAGLKRASTAIYPLMHAFGQIAQIGAPLLSQLGSGFANLGLKFARFIDTATKSGQLAKWLQAAVSTLRTLGQIAGNVGSILITVIQTATATGGNLLSTLAKVTGQIADFLKSAQGTQVLQSIFGTIGGLADALGDALKAVLPALGKALSTLAPSLVPLGNALSGIIRSVAPLLPIIGQLAAVVAGGLTQAFNAIRPALTVVVNALISGLRPVLPLLEQAFTALAPVLGTVAGTIAGALSAGIRVAVYLLQLWLPLITGILNFLASHQWVIKAIIIAIIAWTAVQWLLNVALNANPIGLIIIAILALITVALLVYKNWNTIAAWFKTFWGWMVTAARAVATFFTTTFVGWMRAAWNWIKGIFSSFLNWVVNFFVHSWGKYLLFLLGPIGIIAGAAITIFTHWSTVVGMLKALWNGLRSGLAAIGHWFAGPFVGFFVGAWNRIAAWTGTLVGSVKGLWQGMLNRLVGIWHALQAWVLNPIGNFFIHTIPAAAGTLVGAVKGLWQGMLNRLLGIWNALKAWVLGPIGNFFARTIPAAAGTLVGAVKGLWQGMLNRLLGIWNALKAWVLTPIWNFFIHTIPAAAGTLVGAVKGLWQGMLNRLLGIWNALKLTVINPIGNFFVRTIPAWTGTLVGRVKALWGDMTGRLTGLWGSIKSRVLFPIRDFFTKQVPAWSGTLVGAVKKNFDNLANAVKSIWNKIKNFIKGPIIGALNLVKDGLLGAIWKAGDAFGIGAVKNAAASAQKALGTIIGKVKGFATGGYFIGVGGTTDDKNLALLSNREYVVNAASTKRFGVGNLDYINRYGTLPPGYASGGLYQIPAFASGGVYTIPNKILSIAKLIQGGARMTSGYRPGSRSLSGASDYHSQGKAADLVSGNMDGLAAAFYQVKSYLLELIHTRMGSNTGWYVKNGKAVGPSYYGSEVPVHRDHVHVAMNRAAADSLYNQLKGNGGLLSKIKAFVGTLAGGPGALIDWGTDVYDKYFKGPFAKIAKLGDANGVLGDLMQGLVKKAADGAINWVKDKFSDLLSGGGGSGGPLTKSAKDAQAYAKSILGRYGWGQDQFPALQRLWQGESGWRWNATNPSSGAYGIPQALPASKMASAGRDWKTNASTQVRWGMGYIKSRYGSPSRAYATWLGRNPHWYASGTRSAKRGLAVVGERGPELVDFRGGERVTRSGEFMLSPTKLAAMRSDPSAGGGARREINIFPQQANLDVRALQALLDRQNQLDRMGRPI